MTTEMDTIAADVPVDPDAQATVTDFLDYTEYLPSDLIRSLTLIGKLDDSYLSLADQVHELSATYGTLPNTSLGKRPTSQSLRQEISQNLDQAISARESSYAEASRLYDVVDRHYNRLTSIISKLNSLPKPPSRDPTPVPQVRSPQASRVKTLLKNGLDGTPPQRLMLRFDSARAAGSAGRTSEPTARPRYRSRKVTVPGEVLPPPNPDSPPPVTDSEWEFQPPSPVPMATSRVGATSRNRSIKPGRIRPPKPIKVPTIRTPKVARPPRPPGAMGTNVHSAVAGISTSNALSLLSPPPVDAKPGSQHAPWMRLTEWEMAKLRKRMKKNAIWSPSETMIRRELSDAGRGPENYRSCKAKADALGTEFIDEDKIATTAPGKPLAPGEISADSLGLGETQLSNRGMKLNEAKKLKRETMAREQAAIAAAEAEQAAKRLGDIGNSFKSLFAKPVEASVTVPSTSLSQAKMREIAKDKEKEKERDRQKERGRKEMRDREKEKERERRRKEREMEEEREKEAIEKEKEKEKEKAQMKERERQREIEQEREREREIQKIREKEKEQEKEKEIEREIERKAEIEKERARQREIDEQKEKLKELKKEIFEKEKEKQVFEKEKEKEVAQPSPTKRKRDSTPKAEVPSTQNGVTSPLVKPSPKRRRITQPHPPSISTSVSTKTTTVPLAAPGPSPPIPLSPATPLKSPTVAHRHTAPSTRSRRLSLTLRGPAPPAEPPPSSARPPSRAASRRGSSGPSSTLPNRELRRRSATPAPATPIITAASRRSRRPAPGPVTNSQDGGAAVSEGRRKNAPRKGGTAAAAHARKQAEDADYAREKEEEARAEEEAAGEDIDPDEPRYCVCGDVSFGTMICCENSEVRSSTSRMAFWKMMLTDVSSQCEKEWFHLECVGLEEPPGRRAKWYCPDCKAKLGKK